jgi:DNA-binding MarR family transcriptional regulator
MADADADADAPRRMSLLYQLYLTNQAARDFMRLSLRGVDMSGEAYALYSYFFGNGPRTLTQAARDLGWPITTVSTVLGPLIESGEMERRPHPTDGRARLIALTDAGRERLMSAAPGFSTGYKALLDQLERRDADVEALFAALDALRAGIVRTNQLLAAEGESEN